MEIPLIYDLQTESGNHYVYDAATNYIYFVDEVDIHVIKNLKRMSVDELKSFLFPQFEREEIEISYKKVLLWIQKDGAFSPQWNDNNKFNLPSKEEFFNQLTNVSLMSLELTQQCNMRCKYCIYGLSYKYHREHTNKEMNWMVAKKSLDYYLSNINSPLRTSTKKEAFLSFYGGEPLINFKLMKKCVEYCQQKNPNEITFNLTTNGTLLNEEIIKFFIKHNFDIMISLDGPDSEHDKNRVTKSGNPTFKLIIDKLNMIRNIDVNFYENNIKFNSMYTIATNLNKVIDFFSLNNPLIKNKVFRISAVSSTGTDYYKRKSKKIKTAFNIQILELIKEYLRIKLSREVNDDNKRAFPLNRLFGTELEKFSRRSYKNASKKKFTAATCIPGCQRIFVDVNGVFHICEKINHNFPIGDCYNGIDYNKVKSIYDKFAANICNNCHRCIAVHNCSVCFASAANGKYFKKNELCKNIQQSFKRTIRTYLSIMEENPEAFIANKSLFLSEENVIICDE